MARNFNFQAASALLGSPEMAAASMDEFCRRLDSGDRSVLYNGFDRPNKNNDDDGEREYRDRNDNRRQKKEPARPKRTFGDGTPVTLNENEAPNEVKMSEPKLIHREELKTLEEFLDEYSSEEVKTSYAKQRDIIYRMAIPLCKILSNYFNPKYEDIQGTMDTVLQIMTTDIFCRAFARTLADALGDEHNDPDGYFANWDNDYIYVGNTVATLLGTKRKVMTEETETAYVTQIAKRLWADDIKILTNQLRISEGLATDVILKTPVIPDRIANYQVELYYKGFLDSILLHADDNIEILDASTQGKLLTYLYGNGKNLCKVLGKFLADVPRDTTDFSGVEKLIYGAFKEMLYTRLNGFDIGDIKFVLKYIVNQKKGHPDQAIVFSIDDAADYTNINRALQSYIGDDKDAKDCLNL